MVFHVVLASLTAHFSGSDHNYLSNRYQTVKVNGGVSTSSRELHYGTAQLYTIHIMQNQDSKPSADNNTRYSPSKSITECIKFTKRAGL